MVIHRHTENYRRHLLKFKLASSVMESSRSATSGLQHLSPAFWLHVSCFFLIRLVRLMAGWVCPDRLQLHPYSMLKMQRTWKSAGKRKKLRKKNQPFWNMYIREKFRLAYRSFFTRDRRSKSEPLRADYKYYVLQTILQLHIIMQALICLLFIYYLIKTGL